MALIVKWLKKPPTSPFFYRKFGVSIAVVVMFVVYIANLGKILSTENQGMENEGDFNANKFRFVKQFLNFTFKSANRFYFIFDSL